ncbi:phage tail tape measure protein [Acetobacterium malicum]|uniref:Phage tail tape measure protein n=1 Tax=Acetobacterium malicum TaxID=52692 RepID=A0ABR6Z2Q5_9FIRM|nr:phage tail tape measure protein [Acetobacterium malicum]MBC3901417.1 phage tail tape measure protein [Acetobacterium malicum]
MSLTGGIELAPLVVELKADIAGFKSDMSKAAALGAAEANNISKSLTNTAKVGESLTKVGNTLTKFVSVPLAAVAAGSVAMALEFGNSFAKVSTLLDDGVVNFEDYKEAIIQGSSDSKVAIGDYTEAVYQSISAGVDQTKAIEFTTKAMDLARGGFTTGALAVDVLTTAINGYGLEASDATKISDMLIATQNAGKTTVDELAQSMGKVIPIANSVNFGMEELSASYAQLTFNGIATAEAGTYLKSMLSELGKTGSDTDVALRELSGKGFAQLKAEGVPTADILNMLSQYAASSGKTLKDMFGSVEAGTAALVLASQDGAQYNEFLAKIEGSAGSTQAAIDKLNADPLEQLKGAVNELKNAGIELGGAMAPAISEVASVISDLAHAFSGLSDEQQQFVVHAGLAVMAIGPLLSVAGTAVTTYTKVKPLIAGINAGLSSLGTASTVASAGTTAMAASTTAAGTAAATATASTAALTTEVAAAGAAATTTGAATSGLGSTISGILGGSAATATVAVAAFGAAIAGVAVAGVEAYTQLNAEVIPQVDIFTSKTDEANQAMAKNTGNTVTSMQMAAGTYKATTVEISEATKVAVTAYMNLDTEAQKSMMSLYLNSTTITQEIVTDMTTKYATMGQTINASLESDYNIRLTQLQGFFANSSSITAADQATTLANLKTHLDTAKAENEQHQAQIATILQTAADQHRSITQEEQKTIDGIQKEMKTSAITTLSETEAESAVILGRIKDNDGRITAEMASEHIKTLEDQRVKSVDAANLEYEEKIKIINQMKEEGTIATQEMADQMIADAGRQRDETISAAQATKDQGVTVLANSYDDLGNTVDTNTGNILTNWDRAKNWWSGWFPGHKDAIIDSNAESQIGVFQQAEWTWNGLVFKDKYATIYYSEVTGGTSGGGGGGGGIGSYYNGLNYVPYDGFKATLHKGERVLTEAENRDYTQGNTTDNKEINQEFIFYGNVESPYQVARAAKKAIESII